MIPSILAFETHKAQVHEMRQQHEKEVNCHLSDSYQLKWLMLLQRFPLMACLHFVFQQLSQLKKSQEEQMASLKEEHRDEVVDLESKHSGAIDGKRDTGVVFQFC